MTSEERSIAVGKISDLGRSLYCDGFTEGLVESLIKLIEDMDERLTKLEAKEDK